MEKRRLAADVLPGYDPEIGRWLWALEDVRRTVKAAVGGLSQELLDAKPEGWNSIGSLLYHVAAIEADWLCDEVMGSHWPDEIVSLFTVDVRDDQGLLAAVSGMTLEEHLTRLDLVRSVLLDHFRSMSVEEFRRVLAPPLFGERRRHLYSRHMYMEREVNGIPLLRYY